jgi:hypothetical protein
MAMKLYVWSDKPNDYWHKSQKGQAEGLGEKANARVEQVRDVNSLLTLFRRIRDSGEKLVELRFYAHGNKGLIQLGADSLDTDVINRRFSSERFESMFGKGCFVSFEGCNCAEGAIGEFFIVRVGKVLLRGGGGSVRGSTATTYQYAGNPFGDWVYAEVAPGGGASLSGETHLNIYSIMRRARAAIAAYAKLNKSKWSYTDKQEWDQWIGNVDYYAIQAADTWENNLQACLWLDYVEAKLSPTHSWSM